MLKLKTFKKLAPAALLAAACVPLAGYAASLYTGGATLPAQAFFGDSWIQTPPNPDLRLTTIPDSDSLFGAVLTALGAGNTISYCQTGSGFGRATLLGIHNAAKDCPLDFSVAIDNSPGSTQGFSGAAQDPSFVASDAPMSTSEYNTYLTNNGAAHSEPVSFPATVTTVAIVYNNPSVAMGKFKLDEATLCGIWRGNITNWNQIKKVPHDAGSASWPAKAITLVHRSDSSGTTFAFSNHMNWVCGAPFFNVGSTFPGVFPGGVNPPGAIVTNGSGNPGVVAKVQSTDGAIGYAESGDASLRGLNTWAKIAANGSAVYKDPRNHGKTFPLPVDGGGLAKFTNLDGVVYPTAETDKGPGSNDATFKRPLGMTAYGLPVGGQTGCMWNINPGAYATSVLVAGTSDYKSYPVVGITNVMGHNQGNGGAKGAIRAFLSAPYTPASGAIKTQATTVGADTGNMFLGKVIGNGGSTTPRLTSGAIKACIN